MLDITFSYFFEFFELFVTERRSSEIRVESISADIILKIIMFRSSDIDRHILDIVCGMQSFRYRRPIFVINLAFQ